MTESGPDSVDAPRTPADSSSKPYPATASRVAHTLKDPPEITPPILWVISAASALAAALSAASPVGAGLADVLWCALLGGAVVHLASRARRWALVWLGGIAAVVGIGGDVLGIVSTLALVVLVGLVAVTSERRDRLTAALLGAFAIQALLRGPDMGVTGLPTLVGIVAVLPTIWSGYQMASRRERRIGRLAVMVGAAVVVAASTGVALAVAQSAGTLRAAEKSATGGLDSIRAGATEDAAEGFDRAASQYTRVSDTLRGPLTWVGSAVPLVAQHVEALRDVAASGRSLSEAATVTASTADYRSLTPEGGTVDLERVIALQEPVAKASATIAQALEQVDAIDSVWLLAPLVDELDRFTDELRNIDEQTELASEALSVAPLLLGAEGPKRYFVAFSTPAESRNGGGFIGAYGLLQADRGNLDLLESGDLSELNPRGGLDDAYAFEPPPDWEERYGTYFVQLFLGNVGASPDWPTNTGVVGQLFPQATDGTPIDGAIYADPAALAGLLELTGPVSVPGIGRQLTGRNAEQFLLIDQYVEFDGDNPQRKELLGDVAEATFDALTSREIPGIARLTEVLGPLVEDGHLRVSAFDPTAEALFDRLGLSGRWEVTPGSDFVSVRSANLLPNKIDAFLHRRIDMKTAIDPGSGELATQVTVELRNDAPSEDLPSYIIGNGGEVPTGTNLHLLTLHTPHRLERALLDGEPVGAQNQREFGAPAYSFVVELPPGSTRTLRLLLRGRVERWPYSLEVLPQATANPDDLSVSVSGAPSLGQAPQFAGSLGPRVTIGRDDAGDR